VKKQRPRTSSPQYADLLICLLLLLTTFALYARVGSFEFVNYDDPQSIIDEPHVRSGVTAAGIAWAFASGAAANWMPLTRLSEMLDCQLFGLDSGWHHLVNVLFHALAALGLFAFLRRATGDRWPTAFSAWIFALHPLHVESVAWVSERKDVLSAFFWFLSLWAYVRYAESPVRKGLWYAVALVAFVFGLMCKPMIVSLPFLLLVLDFWPLRRRLSFTASLAEKSPLFVCAVASSVITYLAQRNGGAVVSFVSVPFVMRLGNALVSYIVYIAKTFCPTGLAVFYPYPEHLPIWQSIGAAIALAAVTAVVMRSRRVYPYLAAGWLWYLGTLVPVIGLVQVGSQARADRYLYVPMAGLAIMVAWTGADLARRYPRARRATFGGALLGCAACAAITAIQIRYWKNSESLFRRAIAVTNGNYLAHYNLAAALSAMPGRMPEAVREYEAALRIRPDYAEARNNLGVALSEVPGRLSDVITDYRDALRIAPDSAVAHNNLGNALAKTPGRLPEAVREYEAALRLKPDYAEAHNNLGTALVQLPGGLQESIDQYRVALRLNPDYANAHYNLANALATFPNRLPEAIREYQAALRIDPNSVEAHNNLASAFSRLPGHLLEAIAEYQAALQISPDFAEGHYNLGNLLSTADRIPEAIGEYEAALRIRPDYAEAHGNLGTAFARVPGHLPEAITHFETALQIRPDLAETHYNLGVALLKMPGHEPEAIAQLESALRLKPNPQVQQLVSRLRSGK